LVWQNQDLGNFVNEKYISVRITSDDDEWGEWSEKYGARGTPTVVFTDAQGEEIDRFVGFGEEATDDTIQMVKDFAAGINTLPVILKELEADPESVDLNYKLAKRYLSRAETPKAAPLFAKVLELDPDDTKGYKEEATYRVALQAARTDRDPAALEAFIASEPQNRDYLRTAYTTVASTHARNGDSDKTRDTFEAAMEAFPDDARVTFYYASTIFNYKLEDLYEKGLELNEKAKELNPDYKISTMLNLVTYYGNTDQKDKVPPLFEEAIKEDDGLKSLYASFIVRLEIEDKYDYAIEMMEAEAAKDENAREAYIWFYLGQLHEKKGDKETALTHMRKAAELSPGLTYYAKEVERLEKELQEK
jgi:tetratricopeptide (TPR) repeat protein